MQEEASNRFRPLDAEDDWSFFDPAYAMTTHARSRVQPLSRRASDKLWQREVSNRPLEWHVMTLPDNHWVQPDQPGPNWLAEWNSDTGSEVSEFLQQSFPIAPTEPVSSCSCVRMRIKFRLTSSCNTGGHFWRLMMKALCCFTHSRDTTHYLAPMAICPPAFAGSAEPTTHKPAHLPHSDAFAHQLR